MKMRSLITLQCLCGVFLLFIAIASPRKLRDNSSISNITIEPVTEPVQQTAFPQWDDRSKKLYYVQSNGQKICRFDPATGEMTYADIATGAVGATVPVEEEPNKFMATADKDFLLVTWNPEENCTNPKIEFWGSVDGDKNGTHFNDGNCDSRGRFWAGTMGPHDSAGNMIPKLSSFYRLTSNRVITKEISLLSISSGPAWDKDGKIMYWTDTFSDQVVAFDFDADRGTISNQRVVFDLTSHQFPGHIDGIAVDTKGNLWFAMYDGGTIAHVDPVQGLIRNIPIPANKPTSLTWGGDNFDILYVTTSRNGATQTELATYPNSGSVFAIKGLGARGFPGNSFSLRRHNY